MRKDTTMAGSAILVLDDVERLTSKDKLVDAESQL